MICAPFCYISTHLHLYTKHLCRQDVWPSLVLEVFWVSSHVLNARHSGGKGMHARLMTCDIGMGLYLSSQKWMHEPPNQQTSLVTFQIFTVGPGILDTQRYTTHDALLTMKLTRRSTTSNIGSKLAGLKTAICNPRTGVANQPKTCGRWEPAFLEDLPNMSHTQPICLILFVNLPNSLRMFPLRLRN